MKTRTFERQVTLPVDVETLWRWHAQAGAFERLMPPWQRVRPVDLPATLAEGREASFYLEFGFIKRLWRARILDVKPPQKFVDLQLAGPFKAWRHEHLMTASGPGRATLVDRVAYALPFGLERVGPVRSFAHRELERLFRFRHRRMEADLERHGGALPGQGKTILVTGSTGLIGRRLVPYLRTLGYKVRGLTRGDSRGDLLHWDPLSGEVDPEALAGVDAVIHLAGENIASGRWTRARKEHILQSRIDGTHTLVRAMERMLKRPSVFICASGVNYYAAGPDIKSEDAPPGSGFLAEVCVRWEQEAARAQELGIRTVLMRTGVVLDPSGGALGKMLPAFSLGLGGPIGSGLQGFPWIPMDDLLDIYERAVRDVKLTGAVNAVHPHIVDQGTFSRCLAGVLRRPAFFKVPARLVKLLFGQMGNEALLSDMRVVPEKLDRLGYAFRQPDLTASLAFMLGREPS